MTASLVLTSLEMKIDQKKDVIEVYWTKLMMYVLILLTIVVLFIVVPKSVFDQFAPFRLANSMAMLTEENFMLYDYEVYSTEEAFQKGLVDDVAVKLDEFRERNEIVAVRIYGESERIIVEEDYILILSPDAYDLNIEYYLVINIYVADVSLPVRTFIMLFKDISILVNNIYRAVLIILTLSFFTPISINLTRTVIVIRNQKKFIENK